MFFVASLMLLSVSTTPPLEMDVVIRGGTLIDGSGQPGVRGDLALAGDTIVALGTFEVIGQPRIIDAGGLIVAPGFIDLHSHSDLGPAPLTSKRGRANRNYLFQGVTTVVTGNCGAGPVDVKSYYQTLAQQGVGTNVVHLLPHNAIRSRVMGNVNRPPTKLELLKMSQLVETGMKQGAGGMSTGLIYTPGTYAETQELIALAKVVAEYGGIYASHIRNENAGVVTAVEEAIQIGQLANLPVHISHFKSSGPQGWGKCVDAIAIIRQARLNGLQITADQYPYTASSTSLKATLVPSRYREGSSAAYRKRLDDPEVGPRLRKSIEAALAGDRAERIMLSRYRPQPRWQGMKLATIAKAEQRSVLELVLEIERTGGAQIVNFSMREQDVRLIMQQDFVATASDGVSLVPDDTKPHPRSYGTFPRKIGHYARDEKVIALKDAIYSATGLPAKILQLKDRGILKVGAKADIVLFDLAKLNDVATFQHPHQLATGVHYLLVNGKLAIDQGKLTAQLAGKPLPLR